MRQSPFCGSVNPGKGREAEGSAQRRGSSLPGMRRHCSVLQGWSSRKGAERQRWALGSARHGHAGLALPWAPWSNLHVQPLGSEAVRCRGRGVCGGTAAEKGEMRSAEEKVCAVGVTWGRHGSHHSRYGTRRRRQETPQDSRWLGPVTRSIHI